MEKKKGTKKFEMLLWHLERIIPILGLDEVEYLETPRRIADLLLQCTKGRHINCSRYLDRPLPFRHKEMVVVKDIEFFSTCPHHLWPYFGTVSIAYIPNGTIVGLSKFHSLVDCMASKPMLQEDLTSGIADIMVEKLDPIGTMVVVEAQHTCMFARGRYDYSTMSRVHEITITSALRGVMLTTETPRMEALKLMGR